MEARICFVQTEVQMDTALRDTTQLSDLFMFFFKPAYDDISVFQQSTRGENTSLNMLFNVFASRVLSAFQFFLHCVQIFLSCNTSQLKQREVYIALWEMLFQEPRPTWNRSLIYNFHRAV